ncbi:MAG: glutamine-hydrolyzing carbamoyl-phosphate synthase small subunit [Candidatus Scalindua rubra]|uniref:Carbamoyl phosphate synthase small chain n=1 Tax=Candidatus Scalindua brodae TaxID=237368 RepID=A0A0B0EDJ4_9BACT|nr:MAG: carbamoyl-phosphate synthase small subunit [Candidatus Scalindua brodae]MBZ0108504.1 glutamine-hydrolyzing carbamoyl-phosphate synthase small subunit [Candidatus Scalindua rubra]TWU36359.1 Carbamoyl-phosphate synthase small chain [Candidatus Brocadiaceae bacterium S225]
MKAKKAILALSDGKIFEGISFGAEGETSGEIVFNTSITGYQEILTDPSYKGQIVNMTYPLIGNYGICEEDHESMQPHAEGLIIKELSPFPSNWRSKMSLDEFLKNNGIMGIQGIDTRALTRHIRDYGEQVGIISTADTGHQSLISKANGLSGLEGKDLVKEVSCQNAYSWEEAEIYIKTASGSTHEQSEHSKQYKVIVYDCGVKYNILRKLKNHNCDVIVVPASTSAEEVLSMKPDGIVVSNGPGDPAAVPYMVENITGIIGKKPVMGICLGIQILAQALGYKTFKLKFGHHGGNQPVMDLRTKKVAITSQNHCFAIDGESLDNGQSAEFGKVEITHINLNDKSIEGLRCLDVPAFAVQYHPEASPGPHDSSYIFNEFIEMMVNSQ